MSETHNGNTGKWCDVLYGLRHENGIRNKPRMPKIVMGAREYKTKNATFTFSFFGLIHFSHRQNYIRIKETMTRAEKNLTEIQSVCGFRMLSGKSTAVEKKKKINR